MALPMAEQPPSVATSANAVATSVVEYLKKLGMMFGSFQPASCGCFVVRTLGCSAHFVPKPECRFLLDCRSDQRPPSDGCPCGHGGQRGRLSTQPATRRICRSAYPVEAASRAPEGEVSSRPNSPPRARRAGEPPRPP